MKLTRNNITFLRNINFKLDTSSGWRYHYFEGSIFELSSFIKKIGDDKIYLLIPLFAKSKSRSNATLNLSEPFLVNNRSNPQLIMNLIGNQWESSGFSLKPDTLITFSLKFKRVWIK